MSSGKIRLQQAAKEFKKATDNRYSKAETALVAGAVGSSYVAINGSIAKAQLPEGTSGEVEVVNAGRPASAVYTTKQAGGAVTVVRGVSTTGGTSGDIATAIAIHKAEADPHPVYLTSTEADALYVGKFGTGQYEVPVTGSTPYQATYTALSSFAGNGLTFSSQFNVGAGNGITVSSDAVAANIDTSKGIAFVGSAIAANIDTIRGMTFVSGALAVNIDTNRGMAFGVGGVLTVNVSTAQGMTFVSGALAVNIDTNRGMAFGVGGVLTVNVSTAQGMTFVSGAVAMNIAVSQGLEFGTGGALAVNIDTARGVSFVSGALAANIDTSKGLAFIGGAIAVTVGVGMVLTGGDVTMGTPSSVSWGSSNAATTGTHSHAVTTSNNPGTSASILASSISGGLTLVTFTATTSVTTPLLTATADLTINPVGNVLFPNAQTVRSTTFNSGLTIQGWQINEVTSGTSALTIGTISVDELRAKVFVADEVRVDRGEQVWGKSFGIVETAFTTTPTTGTDGVNVWFENSPAISGAIFTSGDWLRFRIFDNSSGFTIANIWGQVFSTAAGPVPGYLMDSANNRQRWRFVLWQGLPNYTIKKGNVAIDYGASGQPYIFLSAVDPAGAPYIKFNVWTGSNPYTAANHDTGVVIGHLKSVFGVNNEYGIGAGNGFTTADQWLRASSAGVTSNNINSIWYVSGVAQVQISPTTGVNLNLGTGSSNTIQWRDGIAGAVKGEVNTYYDTASSSNLSLKATSPNTVGQSYISLFAHNAGSYIRIRTHGASGTAEHWLSYGYVMFNTNRFQVNAIGGTDNLYLTNGHQDLVNSSYPGANSSEISNDDNTYKGLMLVGNKSSGKRRVFIYDTLIITNTTPPATSSYLNTILTRRSGAALSIANSTFGYASAIMFNSVLNSEASSMTATGACAYYGAQYTGNVSAAGMFYFDANANFFGFYMSQTGLIESNPITWAEKLRIDKYGNLCLNGQSPVGGQGVFAMKACIEQPLSAPTGGGVLYIIGGTLWYMGGSGTITKLANA